MAALKISSITIALKEQAKFSYFFLNIGPTYITCQLYTRSQMLDRAYFNLFN